MQRTIDDGSVRLPQAFVGYDLGHGETSLAWMPANCENPYSHDFPEVIKLDDDNGSWVTAYSISPERTSSAIGSKAINHYKKHEGAVLEAHFKDRPDRSAEAAGRMRLYSELVWKMLQERVERSVPHLVCVGCPTRWGDPSENGAVDRAYGALLEGVHPNVLGVAVVRESRAAMHQALAEARGMPTQESFFKDTLVIDVGSSTTDFTAISGAEDDVLDDGEQLGAGLIDEAILALLPEWEPEPARREALRRVAGRERMALLLECRRAKEDYFRSLWDCTSAWVPMSPEQERRIGEGQSRRTPVSDGAGGVFQATVVLDQPRMEQVLATALGALGSRTWPECFGAALRRVRASLDAQGFRVEKVVLTGGGSRMSFVQRVAREVFPSAAFPASSDPSTFIAKGLARTCERAYKGQRFAAETQGALDEDLGRILDECFATYKSRLAGDFAAAIFDSVILSELHDWKAGRNTTIEQTESFIKSGIGRWLGGTQPREIWTRRTKDLISDVKRRWCDAERVRQACGRFGTEPATFTSAVVERNTMLPPESMPSSLTDLDALIPDFRTVFALVVGAMAAILTAIVAAKAILFPPLLLVAAAIAAGGADYVLRTMELPLFLREWMLSTDRISSLRVALVPKLAERLQQGFGGEVQQLRRTIDESIRGAVDEAVARELKYVR